MIFFLREINCLFTNFLLPQIEGPRKESRSFGACQTQRRNSTHQGCNGQGWRRRSYHMERQGRGANQKRHYWTWRKCQNQVIFCFHEFFLICTIMIFWFHELLFFSFLNQRSFGTNERGQKCLHGKITQGAKSRIWQGNMKEILFPIFWNLNLMDYLHY